MIKLSVWDDFGCLKDLTLMENIKNNRKANNWILDLYLLLMSELIISLTPHHHYITQ